MHCPKLCALLILGVALTVVSLDDSESELDSAHVIAGLRNHFYRAGNDELEDQDSGELEYYLGSSKGSCFQGYSSNWGSEYRAARGTGVGQIIFADQSGPDCKSKCKTKGGGYAQQHDSSATCRCYSKASGDNVKWTGSGWTVCKLFDESAGSTTTECAAKAGLFLHDNGSCEACPAGTFMEIHAAELASDLGSTEEILHSVSDHLQRMVNKPRSHCKPCPDGKWSLPGSIACSMPANCTYMNFETGKNIPKQLRVVPVELGPRAKSLSSEDSALQSGV